MTKAELIKVLVKSQKTRKQITGGLISFKINSPSFTTIDKKIDGYCALGALACEKGLFEKGLDGSFCNIIQPAYDNIINAYGLQNRLGYLEYPECPVCHTQLSRQISSIITHLNDSHNLTFEQIAKHLKKVKMRKLND